MFTSTEWEVVFNDDIKRLAAAFKISDLSVEAADRFRIVEDGISIRVIESFGLPDAREVCG